MYSVDLDHFPPTLSATLNEELQGYGTTSAKLVLCPPCLQVVTIGRINE